MIGTLSASKVRVLSAKETAGFRVSLSELLGRYLKKKDSNLDHLKTVHGVILCLYFHHHMDVFICIKQILCARILDQTDNFRIQLCGMHLINLTIKTANSL